MYELIVVDLNRFSKFKIFQLKSTNGVDSLEYDSYINSILDYLNNKEFKYIKNKVIFKNVRRINKDFFDSKLPLQNVYIQSEKKNINYISHPFDIKVESSEYFPQLGRVYFDSKDYITYFKRIVLDRNLMSNIVSIYAHELVHTQIEKNMYELLENYFDREFLSIFIELVISNFCSEEYNHNAFENRLELFKRNLNNYKLKNKDYELRSYILSSLKAFHLYNYYINSSNPMRKEILNDIKRIFREEITVGTLLNKYEIDYDNSRKIKYLKR